MRLQGLGLGLIPREGRVCPAPAPHGLTITRAVYCAAGPQERAAALPAPPIGLWVKTQVNGLRSELLKLRGLGGLRSMLFLSQKTL